MPESPHRPHPDRSPSGRHSTFTRLLRACLTPVLLLTLLTACAKVGPDFSAPRGDVPDVWQDASHPVASSDADVDGTWWNTFNDPVLDSLVTEARSANLSLHLAALRVFEARARLGAAVGNLYPQTQQGTGGLTWTHPSDRAPTAPQPTTGRDNPDYVQTSAGLDVAWELDFWGKFRRGIEAADADLRASMADHQTALVSVSAEVARSYILYRTVQKQLAIAETNVAIQRESLRIATARFNYGATSERDMRQALSLLRDTEARIPNLAHSLRETRNALCVLLGKAPQDISARLGDTPIPTAPTHVAVGIPADLLRRRPDVHKALATAAGQCARLGVAKADFYPAFTLGGFVGFTASNVGAFGLGDTFSNGFTAYGGPGLSLPLFNYGRIVSNVRAQDARFQQSLTSYRETVLVALRETEDAIDRFIQAQGRTALLTESASDAARSMQLALIQYQEGSTDFTTVLTAARDLATREDALAAAKGEICQSLVAMFKALGGGWHKLPGDVFIPVNALREMRERTHWGSLLEEDAPPASEGIRLPDM
ncbi:efflux transporter outer membrane subunit [Nitratidesulfovibrio vulgaris]|uniref:efflux transporter outer membrane subunit n=1 Tax=Nitratidesulfovibrio vulgaris TaxID=881 RepID=UPI0013DFEFA5|nr:efflux transporter outer membrane subunit [Nitratidesulfovibrio vulgaris]